MRSGKRTSFIEMCWQLSATTACLLVTTACFAKPSTSHRDPAVAYLEGGVVHVLDARGRPMRTIPTSPAATMFSLSRRGLLVFASGKRDGFGGALYSMAPDALRASQLSRDPYYLSPGERSEIYAAPDIAPDGRHLVFSIHSQDHGDAWQAGGPFAVMDMETHDVSVVPLNGEMYADSAFWSPDGKLLLMNFEDGSSMGGPSGQHIRNLPFTPPHDWDWSTALGWTGNRCVVVIGGKGPQDASLHPALYVNIQRGLSGRWARLMKMRDQLATRLVAVSGSRFIRRTGKTYDVHVHGYSWSIPNADKIDAIEFIGTDLSSDIPEECR